MTWLSVLVELADFFGLNGVQLVAAAIAVVLLIALGAIALRAMRRSGADVEWPAAAGPGVHASASALLVGRSGQHAGRSIPVPATGLILGRDQRGGGLAFDASSDVSRRHCTVRYDGALLRFKLTDHDSANGTFLLPSEQKLKPRRETICRAGQLIRLGRENVFELKAN